MKGLEWFVARRYLSSRRRGRFLSLITLIAVGGVFLGVTALITVIAVMTGLQRDLQRMILGSTPHVYVFETGPGLRVSGWRELLPRLAALEGVTATAPFILTQVGVVTQGYTFAQAGTLYGIDPDASERPLTVIEEQVRSGELGFGPTESGHPGVLLGSGLAQRLNVMPGDTVMLAALENLHPDPLTGYPIPRTRPFEVSGIFRTGMFEYDNQHLYVRLAAGQELLDLAGDTVTGVAVNIHDPWAAREIAARIHRTLGPQYYVNSWMELNSSLFSALKLEKLAMAIILFLIVVVAAFNIVSTLIMVVADKTREIGILKAMGMTDRAVLRIFVLQGMAIGLIGTALGAVGGVTLVWLLDRYQFVTLPGDVYFIDRLPVALDPLDVALILTISVLISFTATVYPARQASRLLPVEAIRHE